jgi:hypothetical protein
MRTTPRDRSSVGDRNLRSEEKSIQSAEGASADLNLPVCRHLVLTLASGTMSKFATNAGTVTAGNAFTSGSFYPAVASPSYVS